MIVLRIVVSPAITLTNCQSPFWVCYYRLSWKQIASLTELSNFKFISYTFYRSSQEIQRYYSEKLVSWNNNKKMIILSLDPLKEDPAFWPQNLFRVDHKKWSLRVVVLGVKSLLHKEKLLTAVELIYLLGFQLLMQSLPQFINCVNIRRVLSTWQMFYLVLVIMTT